MITTQEKDFLDEDKPIRGQNYVCLSFLSPEDVIANKEVYYVERFMSSLNAELQEMITNLEGKYTEDKNIFAALRERYPHFLGTSSNDLQDQFRHFKSVNEHDVEKAFHEKNDFRTSMRGIKVRGVFDTLPEAQNRADFLKKQGDKFDIYVAQVGCWCPWSPNPQDIQDAKYSETQLNTLMQKYNENVNQRDLEFEERKQSKVLEAAENVRTAREMQTVVEEEPAEAMEASSS